MKKTVTANGQEINLPEDFTWILFRHGDKTNQSPTRGGELTLLGRKQVWNTSCQLLEYFGQEAMSQSAVVISPVHRVQQSKNIFMSAIDRDPDDARVYATLEWGPNDSHDFDYTIINVLKDHHQGEIVIAIGHNGLFENIAQIIHPRSEGWQLPPRSRIHHHRKRDRNYFSASLNVLRDTSTKPETATSFLVFFIFISS